MKRSGTIRAAKTKALMSCADTAQLICAFVFAWTKVLFSHDTVHIELSDLRFTISIVGYFCKLKKFHVTYIQQIFCVNKFLNICENKVLAILSSCKHF